MTRYEILLNEAAVILAGALERASLGLDGDFAEAADQAVRRVADSVFARLEELPVEEVVVESEAIGSRPEMLPLPAVATGVGDGFWDQWSRNSKRLEGEARDESFREAVNWRVGNGLVLPAKWSRMAPEVRMSWLRANDR